MQPTKADQEAIQVTNLFAVVNGDILADLGENVSATYTRIHYLLNGLRDYPDVEVKSIQFQANGQQKFNII